MKINLMEIYQMQEYEANEAYNMLQQGLDLYNHKVQTLERMWALIENVMEEDEFIEWDNKYVGWKELKLETDEIQQVTIFFLLFLLNFVNTRILSNNIEHSRTSIFSNLANQLSQNHQRARPLPPLPRLPRVQRP